MRAFSRGCSDGSIKRNGVGKLGCCCAKDAVISDVVLCGCQQLPYGNENYGAAVITAGSLNGLISNIPSVGGGIWRKATGATVSIEVRDNCGDPVLATGSAPVYIDIICDYGYEVYEVIIYADIVFPEPAPPALDSPPWTRYDLLSDRYVLFYGSVETYPPTGWAEWNADGWPEGFVVLHNGSYYRALIDNFTEPPSADWELIDPPVDGILENTTCSLENITLQGIKVGGDGLATVTTTPAA